jgi:hypothetical protein
MLEAILITNTNPGSLCNFGSSMGRIPISIIDNVGGSRYSR